MSDYPLQACPVRVYYEDTDFSGRVYHASYLRFLERGRTEWLRELGLGQRELDGEENVIFAVHRLRIDYRRPALMDDLLQVITSIVKIREASLSFRQKIARDGLEIAAAEVLVVTLRHGRPVRLPERLLKRLGEARER